MAALTDFHSHILPGLDDGSPDPQVSLQMLRVCRDQGVRIMVATPHFDPRSHNSDSFIIRRRDAAIALRSAGGGEQGFPKLRMGAEVYYYPGMGDSQSIRDLAISGSRAILVEMPRAPWTMPMLRDLERLYTKQGLIPIIAHLDRYITPLRTFGLPQKLQQLPVVVQANADFFLRRSTARFALTLLERDQIHILGSDCHNMTDRAPNLGAALQVIHQKLGGDVISRMQAREQAILDPDSDIDDIFQEVST